MKKVIIGFIVFWVGFNLLYNQVNAGEYDKAVLGNVITNSSKIDKEKLFEAEMARIGHQYALEMVSIMQKYLPSIIDAAMADLRLKLDAEYKCELLKDTKIADNQCL